MAETTNIEVPKLKCIYGNDVVVKNLTSNEVQKYTLVSFSDEVLNENKISNYTEIGRAIWAKHEGDEVEINLPRIGMQRYKILEICNTPKAK